MLRRIRHWLIEKLAGTDCVALNLLINTEGLHVYSAGIVRGCAFVGIGLVAHPKGAAGEV